MKQNHRPRQQTERLIIEAVAQSEGLTRTEIARAIGRTKTPHLIELIDSLVEKGHLIQDIFTFNNGVQGYLYRLGDIPYDGIEKLLR